MKSRLRGVVDARRPNDWGPSVERTRSNGFASDFGRFKEVRRPASSGGADFAVGVSAFWEMFEKTN
ncbi:MAG: hypothetical protein IJN32_08745 [Thermoguttaceae bacterium]|nr:hypothetical protein [Thermoguttaceae bacterium]